MSFISSLPRPRVLAVFLIFVLAVSVLAWRTQAATRGVAEEREQRIEAICQAVNQTRAGIDSFLHETITAPPSASAAQRDEVTNFLKLADRDFRTIPCKHN